MRKDQGFYWNGRWQEGHPRRSKPGSKTQPDPTPIKLKYSKGDLVRVVSGPHYEEIHEITQIRVIYGPSRPPYLCGSTDEGGIGWMYEDQLELVFGLAHEI